MKNFCLLFVIYENYKVVQPKIKDYLLKFPNQAFFYPSCQLALNGVKHNMPGGKYFLLIIGSLSTQSVELIETVKKLQKSNRVCIYTEEKPQNMNQIDFYIPVKDFESDFNLIKSFFN